MPKAGGKCNTFGIIAKGRQITVVLNGQNTLELPKRRFAEGPLGLEHGASVINSAKAASKAR